MMTRKKKMKIRKASLNDLKDILSILSFARNFMKENGNPTQWGDDWPSEWIIKEDIEKGQSFVVVDDNDKVLATYAFIIGIDKTYIEIREGKWLSDDEYGTIHRLGSSQKEKDIFSFIMSEIKKLHINIRVDTHENNKPMISQLLKNGFTYCGHISPIEGGDRLAYELLNNK